MILKLLNYSFGSIGSKVWIVLPQQLVLSFFFFLLLFLYQTGSLIKPLSNGLLFSIILRTWRCDPGINQPLIKEFFFYLGFFFANIYDSQDNRGRGAISLTLLYQFHPLHGHLHISLAITAESSFLQGYLDHFQAQAQKVQPEKNSLYFGKWNFLASISKKLLHLLKGKVFLYFLKWNLALFTPNSKNKRNPPQENFLRFWKRKPRRNFLCFLKRKLFLYLRKRKLRNGNSNISRGNLQSPKNKQKSPLWRNFLSLMTLLQFLHQ